jgi:hypothetical protein
VLLDLSAVESIDTICAAFTGNRVDLSLQGDIEDVEIELGLRTRRATQRKPDPTIEGLRSAMFDAMRRADLPVQARPKTGRNDPCPCGSSSSKKYKKCCMTTDCC